MDLGCGAGSASLYFTRAGYQVLAVDGCRELCEHTRNRAGCEARQLRFEELDYTDAFDGIWACASLLHVRKSELPGVLRLIRRALKPNGTFYASFKYGTFEGMRSGRYFTDFTEESLKTFWDSATIMQIFDLWITHDVRPGREEEKWINLLARRV